MKLRLACADFTFPLLSHDHSLDLIAMQNRCLTTGRHRQSS